MTNLIYLNQNQIDNQNKINDSTVQTMSSVEIAELCGKRHDHVMRDVKKMLEEISAPKFGGADFLGSYIDEQKKPRPCYHLPKRECLILISGYSTTLRAKIIDRWQQLEEQLAAPKIDYSKPEALLGVLNHLQSQIDQQNSMIAELEPKAMALDHLQRSEGLLGIREAAKDLGVAPNDLSGFLRRNKWVYKMGPDSPSLPYQDKINRGLMDCVLTTIKTLDGRDKIVSSVKITSKGMAKLAKEIKKQTIH
ncbi:phage antirepressor KilAC domain-containing protein [Bartonella vinsonii]|uniref:Uncharacterized phage-encoded protein n=1 Tax=Bartonella vinsonii TaxID=33047 RepID=A0A3S5C0F2_BARVI|nr:phage regulatory protein/antirepressor Ant [Bartonella vinsonii]VEJ45247.1 Uncharacterized phage-encoded protein [Bartonella vinsonii]